MKELIDFHAHIIPHMDHGSANTPTARTQLSMMQAAGVTDVCATSHFYPQDILPDDFLSHRAIRFSRLLSVMGNTPRPRILLGAEVLVCKGMENMERLDALCFEGTNVLLLEMPFNADAWSDSLLHTVEEIGKRGLRPVMAHVDRYPAPLVEELFEMGFQGQINAEALAGLIRPKHLLRWIGEGRITGFGSDLHGCAPKGYKAFTKLQKTMPAQVESVMASAAELLKNAKRY